MAVPGNDTTPTQRTRVIQLIHVAMIMGVVMFMIFVLFFRAQGNAPPRPPIPKLSYAALVFAVGILAAHAIIPDLVVRGARRQTERKVEAPTVSNSNWYALYQTRSVVGAALLEGASFFLLIAYMMEGDWYCLVAVALRFVLWIAEFPTRARVERWVDKQRANLYRRSPA